MNQEMQALMAVAEQDRFIHDLRRKLKHIPQQIAEARKQLDAEQVQLDEVKIPHDGWEREVREKAATIQIADDTINKFEAHLKNVTTQQEYIAARKQIDEARRLSLRLEDEIKEFKTKQEEVFPRLTERQGHYDNVLEAFKAVEGEILKVKAELEAEMAKHEALKAEAAKALEARTLAYYERLNKSGRIPALVPSVNGVCSGCNIAIPPQLYNQLIANPNRYGTCSHCTRMLYYVPVVEPEAEGKVESKSA